MVALSAVVDLINNRVNTPCHPGYAPTGTLPPYSVARPLITDHEATHLDGSASAWDVQFTVYCCGASVEASYNVALELITAVQGARLAGTTLDTSMGYLGAPVEGHYETQVTIQLNQGGM